MSSSCVPSPAGSPDREGHRVPNLLIIGAMKASTTTLYELLQRHPQIWFPREKEPHYFTSPTYGQSAAWEIYLDGFRGCPPEATWTGEASTGYTKLPHLGPTPQRIQQALGDPRLIYILRDPVDRVVSNFRHNHAVGLYRPGFSLDQALVEDPIILSASMYARQLRAYREIFDAAALNVLIAEQLHQDERGALQPLWKWLHLQPPPPRPNQRVELNRWQDLSRTHRIGHRLPMAWRRNVQRWVPTRLRRAIRLLVPAVRPPEVTDSQRQHLLELVADDLRDLKEMMGDRIADWPSVKQL